MTWPIKLIWHISPKTWNILVKQIGSNFGKIALSKNFKISEGHNFVQVTFSRFVAHMYNIKYLLIVS